MEKRERLLKAKIAVAVQNEFGRVPTEEEIDRVFHLTRVMYKAVLGLHYRRKEQEEERATCHFLIIRDATVRYSNKQDPARHSQ